MQAAAAHGIAGKLCLCQGDEGGEGGNRDSLPLSSTATEDTTLEAEAD